MQIGVVGSGIAGLVASRLLTDLGHNVTLFEKRHAVGIDAHSVDIPFPRPAPPTDSGVSSVRADVPSRMFNERLWPGLWRLYQKIGVTPRTVDSSQSFGCWQSPTSLTLPQANRPSMGPRGVLSARNRQVLKEAKRLQDSGKQDLENGIDTATTFGQYLKDGGYSQDFIRGFLYPTLSSTVFTCSFQSLDQYPAVRVLETLWQLTMEQAGLFRSGNGTRDVARRLLNSAANNEPLFDLRLSCSVESVQHSQSNVTVTRSASDGQQDSSQTFDHVVVATQANHAIRLVPGLSATTRATLESFKYENVPVSVHTDERLMPPKRRDWSTFNMLTTEDNSQAMCTVWLNRFHDDWELEHPVFQTINGFVEPDQKKTIRKAVMQRPVVNTRSIEALQQLAALHNDPARRIWFCGSYAAAGTPLLESGVQSAEAVVERIERIERIESNAVPAN